MIIFCQFYELALFCLYPILIKKLFSLQVWTFLLGYYSYDSTYAEREYLMSVKKSEYETLKRQWQVVANYICHTYLYAYICLYVNVCASIYSSTYSHRCIYVPIPREHLMWKEFTMSVKKSEYETSKWQWLVVANYSPYLTHSY